VLEPPVRQKILEIGFPNLAHRGRHQKSRQFGLKIRVLVLVILQQGITAIPEQSLFGSKMLVNDINQLMPDGVELDGNPLAAIRHTFNSLLAKAQYNLVLIIEHPVSNAIGGLPLREILHIKSPGHEENSAKPGKSVLPSTACPTDFVLDT
jgi:hypothetical protein